MKIIERNGGVNGLEWMEPSEEIGELSEEQGTSR